MERGRGKEGRGGGGGEGRGGGRGRGGERGRRESGGEGREKEGSIFLSQIIPCRKLPPLYHTRTCIDMLERDEEGRKKEASKVKQTNKAKKYKHPRQSHSQRKNELPRVGLEPTTCIHVHMYMYMYSEWREKSWRCKNFHGHKFSRWI